MVATAAGSRDAFAVLVARYTPRMTSYCARVTADRRAGEELAQDALLAVWRTRQSYRPDAVAAEARHKRHLAIGASLIDLALCGTLFAIDRSDHYVWSRSDSTFDTLIGVAAVTGAAELWMTAGESPIERTARSWDDNLSLGNLPVHAIGLGGTF